ncbi:uncharacterized protein JCM6883_001945 [Sporobolomyces salmoneus]|uniref:uncharacterized protein n=1 Tax=Sporobolomyces salmoneus TaxID=183962 RepID=UPI00316E5256
MDKIKQVFSHDSDKTAHNTATHNSTTTPSHSTTSASETVPSSGVVTSATPTSATQTSATHGAHETVGEKIREHAHPPAHHHSQPKQDGLLNENDAKAAVHDHQHLAAVTHETHQRHEVEEVERQREVDRHVHHVQHHVQPVLDTQHSQEGHHQKIVPETNIKERHVATDEDKAMLASLNTARDERREGPSEKTIIDKGEQVHTNTSHHVHHLVQPVIERDTHEHHRTHTVVPIHQETHEAPIVHQSVAHEPMALKDFVSGGGDLKSNVAHDPSLLNRVFQPETPSRVLRRIEDLNQQSLPDLPGLPADQTSFSEDGDSTVAHSPPPRNPSSTRVGSPILPPSTNSPYTSTPAPTATFYRSQSTVIPSTASTRYSGGNDTTSTARPPPQLDSLRRPQPSTARSEIESSFNDTMSEIGKRGGTSSEDEDMVVLSGSGGEESDREGAAPVVRDSVELSELPEPRVETAETTNEDQTTRDEPETSLEEERHPLDALSVDESLVEQPQKRSAAPSALSPLRARDLNSTTIASPELGRNYSPRNSPHSHLQDSLLSSDLTPSRSHGDKTPTASLTPTRLGTPTLDSPIASLTHDSNLATPHANQTDAARRANHLLTTLRSTAKPRFIRGTPHPLRSVRKASDSSSSLAPPDDDQRSTSSFVSDHSSNDLTTFHAKANTSLPSGGSADVGGATSIGSRFNGAKLNAYLHQLNTHLTEENQQLVKTLKKTTDVNERLQYTIREMSVAGGISVDDVSSSRRRGRSNTEEEDENEGSRIEVLGKELEGLVDGQRRIRGLQDRFEGQVGGKDAATRIQELEDEVERARQQATDKDDEIRHLREQILSSQSKSPEAGGGDTSSANLVAELQQEVFDLKDALDTATSERDTAQADLVKLEADFTAAGQASEKDFANLQGRIDELLEDLQEKDVEVEAVKQLLVDQETEFAEKMEELERELSKVMEEQEKKVEAARNELESKRKEDESTRRSEKEALERIKAERDALEQRLEKEGKALDEVVEKEIASLKRDIEARDDELNRMQEELEAAEGSDEQVEELKKQIKAKDEEIQQLEGALDESASQLLQNEDDLSSLRQQLASEKQVNSSLSAQISQFSVVKAKSPLGQEVFNSDKDDVIASLEEELEEARQEIIQLHKKLASNANEDRSAEIRDLEIQKLETTKADLEDRVKSLRQQVSIQFSPTSQTPDKSWLLRPLPAVRTPKTPGQFLSNLSNWSPNGTANETISPLLAQIQELEQMVEHLQKQLVAANDQIDNKLDRLEAAGFDTISIARQLSTSQGRIAELEGQLERLLGENGSIERVRARLTKVNCPECSTTFDANRMVKLRVDQSGISFEGFTTQGKAVDSLRSDFASATAKLVELRTEVTVLRSQASRSKNLTSEKATLLAHQESLSKDLRQARDEISVLETDLRTERSRLRTLVSENSATAKTRSTLEARIATLETELRTSARSGASSTELDSLLTALRTKEAEQRRLQDERGDILRGVASLQADMNRVRQEAISLGLDLAGVRRERDEFAKKQAMEKSAQSVDAKSIDELRARHKQESKGLLVLVRQLKLRVNREAQFRYQTGEQKEYLSRAIKEKQATIDSIMSQLNLSLPAEERSRPTFRSAALAICALSRMRRLSQQWKEDSVPKKRLREQAYPEVRGKPYPA